MKTNLLKIAIMAVVAIIATTAQTVSAEDSLYVYAPNGTSQSLALNNLQKLTFTGQGIDVHLAGNNLSTLLYNNISVITFNPKQTTTPETTPEILSNLNIYRNEAGMVVIESSTEINAIRLYSAQGALLQQLTPKSLSATLSLSDFTAGLYIIRIVNRQGQITTHKIINP